MQKSTFAKILALAATVSLGACADTPPGQEAAPTSSTTRDFYVNTSTDIVSEVTTAGRFYYTRIADFQAGQLCLAFADGGMQCTSFANLNEQQTTYLAAARARLDAAKRPAANASR